MSLSHMKVQVGFISKCNMTTMSYFATRYDKDYPVALREFYYIYFARRKLGKVVFT